jgi:hypothetical protein
MMLYVKKINKLSLYEILSENDLKLYNSKIVLANKMS